MTGDLFPEARVAPEADPDRRYTTRVTFAWCARRAGVSEFDLDVAADQERHLAPRWFGVAENGLERPWSGRVWCNPPYSDIEPWVAKAWRELELGQVSVVAMLLPANRTDQPWWQELVEPARDVNAPGLASVETHFLPGRTRFGHPGNPEANGVGSPPFACVLLVFRPRSS